MKRLLALVLMISAAPVFADADAFPPIPSTPVVAHRGFSGIKPENTLAAFRAAVDVGANGAECDIRRAADGVIYIMHDGNFKRTAGHDVAAGTIPYSEIESFDAGEGEKIPTLESYLTLLKGTATRPIIEVKEDGFEEQLVEMIRAFELEKTAVVIDFSAARVKKIRELAPEICVAWLCGFNNETPEDEIVEKIIATLKDCNTNVVDMQFGRTTPALVQKLHEAGISVWCWTVDNPEDIARLYDMGVDSVTTNFPDRALECYRTK
ncbi:MAG: hypothetical protein J6S42_02510 [Thermoguttaceae bacterium]|nr:hypothetical protein [Thermoguttaceae bacterium]